MNHELEHNITCIDTQHMRDEFVASYLIKEQKRVAFVDTGCYFSVPNLLQTLKDKNIKTSQVEYIFVTHAHLDHAGGAGELLKYLENAKVVANSSCAKHLINPINLKAGVVKVYGEIFFKQHLGDIVPVPKDRIIIAENQSINLGNRELQLITTYGHAYHHYVVFDKLSNGVFSGDTLGASYGELNSNNILIFPPTTPTQFNPEEWIKTIDKITNLGIDKIYPTHYNQLKWDLTIAQQLKQRILDFCEIAKSCKTSNNRVKDIQILLFKYLKKQTTVDEKITNTTLKGDIILCAKGLNYWLDKELS